MRLRLTWSEVERLRETGLVEESVNFGAGEVLAYRLQSGMEQVLVGAAFRQGIVTVSVSKEAAQAISATLQTQAQPKARPPGRRREAGCIPGQLSDYLEVPSGFERG